MQQSRNNQLREATITSLLHRSAPSNNRRTRYALDGMDPQLTDLLREMESATQQHGGTPRIAREAGLFLNLLVKATCATRLLLVGAANGYTALWLAEAACATGGTLLAIERDVWKVELLKKLFARSPHRNCIDLLLGDALELLPVAEGPFDFVLLNGEKTQTLHYFHILAEKLKSGALICCAKAMSNAGALTEYLTYVHERPGLESVLVPIGEGIEMTYKSP